MSIGHDDAPIGATARPSFEGKTPPMVLVVDDSVEIRNYLSLVLRANGYRVLAAEDGLAAQIILRLEHPTLVISDLDMPVCDGWDLLVYYHAQHPDLPILIISGAALGKHPEIECLAAGFVPKPVDFVRMRTEIQRLISQAA